MAYDATDVEVDDRTIAVETIVLIAAYTVIVGISLTSFLISITYTLAQGKWLLVAGMLCGTVIVLYVYYLGLETIFVEFHRG